MNRWVLLIVMISLLFWLGCKTPEPAVVATKTITAFTVKALETDDLSEDGTTVSSQNDEVVLVTVRGIETDDAMLAATQVLTFDKNTRSHPLGGTYYRLSPEDRISFFLIELDEDNWNETHGERCRTWATSPGFPASFNLSQADTLLGDDDLLGMQSFLVKEWPAFQEITFSGRQLFDTYTYRLQLEEF